MAFLAKQPRVERPEFRSGVRVWLWLCLWMLISWFLLAPVGRSARPWR